MNTTPDPEADEVSVTLDFLVVAGTAYVAAAGVADAIRAQAELVEGLGASSGSLPVQRLYCHAADQFLRVADSVDFGALAVLELERGGLLARLWRRWRRQPTGEDAP